MAVSNELIKPRPPGGFEPIYFMNKYKIQKFSPLNRYLINIDPYIWIWTVTWLILTPTSESEPDPEAANCICPDRPELLEGEWAER